MIDFLAAILFTTYVLLHIVNTRITISLSLADSYKRRNGNVRKKVFLLHLNALSSEKNVVFFI